MQRSRKQFMADINTIVLSNIRFVLHDKPVWGPNDREMANRITEEITEYVHTRHYPMAPEPEFIEDSSKPPVDPGPGRIA